MRFSTLIASTLAAASVALASPLSMSTAGSGEVAGSVVTNTSVTYYMDKLYDIKAWANKDANGMYPRPLTYEVKAGFTCIFYLEATRGVGSPIGQFAGPTTGVFKDWVTTYKCWPGTNSVASTTIASRSDPEDGEVVAPKTCGWGQFPGDIEGGDLECGSPSDNPKEFLKNGYPYEANAYGIFERVTCKFFIKKGSPIEIKGLASGTFDGRVATHYLCWRGPPTLSENSVTARDDLADVDAGLSVAPGCAIANVPHYGKIELACGKEANWPNPFPKDGADWYRVRTGATCSFWVGPKSPLPDVKGHKEGNFGGKLATEWKCWLN